MNSTTDQTQAAPGKKPATEGEVGESEEWAKGQLTLT